jgi:hypothetical protein
MSCDSSIYYTAHHNWAWVLAEAVKQISNETEESSESLVYLCKSIKELPSQKTPPAIKTRIKYALFRVELIKNSAQSSSVHRNIVSESLSVWATSSAFAFLDAKDALYRELQRHNAGFLMPKTTLLDWDINTVDQVCKLPTVPALLKAALGSGGFGLYFVYSESDVLAIMKAHADRAKTFPGFLDSLRRDHGNVPSWSLQSVVNSYRTLGESNGAVPYHCTDGSTKKTEIAQKRCQIRVYVVCRDSHLYMYDTYEARIPSWDIDLDKELSSNPTDEAVWANNGVQEIGEEEPMTVDEFESYCCAGCQGRPYNKDRNKYVTERFIFDELDDIVFAKEVVGNCVREAMIALQKPISAQMAPAKKQINTFNIQININPAVDHEIDDVKLRNQESHEDHNKNHSTLEQTSLNDDDNGFKNRVEMAIAGIDLMLEIFEEKGDDEGAITRGPHGPRLSAYILEINNNPAMPGESKKMSVKYKQHLSTFVKRSILLGLGETNTEKLGFEHIW